MIRLPDPTNVKPEALNLQEEEELPSQYSSKAEACADLILLK
jgi:hypothetical protein